MGLRATNISCIYPYQPGRHWSQLSMLLCKYHLEQMSLLSSGWLWGDPVPLYPEGAACSVWRLTTQTSPQNPGALQVMTWIFDYQKRSFFFLVKGERRSKEKRKGNRSGRETIKKREGGIRGREEEMKEKAERKGDPSSSCLLPLLRDADVFYQSSGPTWGSAFSFYCYFVTICPTFWNTLSKFSFYWQQRSHSKRLIEKQLQPGMMSRTGVVLQTELTGQEAGVVGIFGRGVRGWRSITIK